MWPARSPDLSILGFLLWGDLQNKIYAVLHNIVADLLNATH